MIEILPKRAMLLNIRSLNKFIKLVFLLSFLLFNASAIHANFVEDKISSIGEADILFGNDLLGFTTNNDCNDSLSIKLPTQPVCSGDKFDIEVSLKSGSKILWYNTVTGGTPIDTTVSGESKTFQLESSTQFYLASLEEGCESFRQPLAILVNPTPISPNLPENFEICADSLIDINNLIIDAPDNVLSSFEIYKDKDREVLVEDLVGAGEFYVFQENLLGCFSEPSKIVLKEIVCEDLPTVNIEKTTTVSFAEVEDELLFTIKVSNSGEDDYSDVIIEDILPSGFDLADAGKFEISGDTLRLQIDSLQAGKSYNEVYSVIAKKSGELTNKAFVKSIDKESFGADSLFSQVTISVSDTIAVGPNWPVIKKSANKELLVQGETLSYLIEVSNEGTRPIIDIVVKDTLTAGLSLIQTGGTADLIVVEDNIVTAHIDTLKIGKSERLLIEVRADSVGEISNIAHVLSFFGSLGNENLQDTISVNVLKADCELPSPVISAMRTHINLGDTLTLTAVGCTNVIWSNGKTGRSINISPTETTSYYANCYSEDCQGPVSNTIEVSVVGVLKPVISASRKELCYGQDVVLTVDGCDAEIKWSNGEMEEAITVTPLKTTSYYVICQDSSLIAYQSDPVTIVVDTNKIGYVETKTFLENSCPDDFVNLKSAVQNYSRGSELVFKNGVYPNSSDADSLIFESGLYYAFVKNDKGCFSEGSPITVEINDCDSTSYDIDLIFSSDKSKPLFVGDTLTLKAIVTNSDELLSDIEVKTTFPEEIDLVSTSQTVSIKNGQNVWFVPELDENESDTLSYKLVLLEEGTFKINSGLFVNRGDSVKTVEQTLVVSKVQSCIAAALQKDTTQLEDGTFLLDLITYLSNCGSYDLVDVKAMLSLERLFEDGMEISPLGTVNINPSSTLTINDDYDGLIDTNLLFVGSTLPVGKTDTITVKLRVAPRGNVDKYYLNTLVSALTFDDTEVSDVSNDGNVIIPELDTSTIVRFGPSPALVTTLSVSELKEEEGNAAITFKAMFRNNTAQPLSEVIVSDSLFTFFGNAGSFVIDSVTASGGLVIDTTFTGKKGFVNLTTAESVLDPGVVETLEFKVLVSEVETNLYYNQLLTEAQSDTTQIQVLSHWTDDIEEEGNQATEIHLDKVIIKETECLGISLAATNKTQTADGHFDITYTAIIANCGTEEIINVSLCDSLASGMSGTGEVSLLVRPKVNSTSLLFLNRDFNGDSDQCFFNKDLSRLPVGAVDTLTYTVRIKPDTPGTLMKNLTVAGMVDTLRLSTTSSDGLNPYLNNSIPTIVVLDSTVNEPYLGLAKKLDWVNLVDSTNNRYDMEFTFTVKNYSAEPISHLQITDDLWEVFGDSVKVLGTSFTQYPAGWEMNPLFGASKEEINLLADSTNQISELETVSIKFIVSIELISTNNLKFENFGVVIGRTIDGSTLEDISTDGINPDSNGSGSPLDDSHVTVIDLSTKTVGEFTPLGIAKEGEAELTSSGSTKITYTVYVKNYGLEELREVQLSDDLDKVFDKSTQFVLLSEPKLNSQSSLVVNPSYDGVTDTQLLLIDSWLDVGAQDTLAFSVGVFNEEETAQTYKNQVVGTADYLGFNVIDLSVEGDNPDVDGDGNPGNDSGFTINVIDPGVVDKENIKVIIPDGISPNGDGINDEFVIRLENGVPLSELGILKLEIFNRWGHPVYKSKNYALDIERGKGWKGNTNTGVAPTKSSSLPVGTYYYVLSSSNKQVFGGKKKVGYVTLMR